MKCDIRSVLVTAVLCCVSCATTAGTGGKAEGPKAPTAADFYPLVIGTKWQYELDVLSQKETMTVSMVKQTSGVFEDSKGRRLQVDEYGVRDQERYLLRNPIETGAKWNNVISASSVEHYEIIGVDQPCESPAGKWQGCVIVQSRNRAEQGKILVNETTFAPGVGIVHLTTTLESNGQRLPQVALELISFAPVQPPSTTPKP